MLMFGWGKGKKRGDSNEKMMHSILLTLEQEGVSESANWEAYKWLDYAMFASRRIRKREREARSARYKRVYPSTAYQTEKMSQLLKRAKKEVVEPSDEIFVQRYNSLSEVVKWSSKRYRNWNWALIGGFILSTIIFWGINCDREIMEIKPLYDGRKVVEQWEDPATSTPLTEEQLEELSVAERRAVLDYGNVEEFRDKELTWLNWQAKEYEEDAVSSEANIDHFSPQIIKDWFAKRAESRRALAAECRAEAEVIPAMEFPEFKEYAISSSMSRRRNCNYRKMIRMAIFSGTISLIYILIYMIAQLPRGYTLTRTRIEVKIFNFINTFLLSSSIILIFSGIFSWFTVEFKKGEYVSKADRDEAAKAELQMNTAGKFGMVLIGSMLLLIIPLFLMFYQIVTGFLRNYNPNRMIARTIDYTKRYTQQQ